jgi:hypothetical protein
MEVFDGQGLLLALQDDAVKDRTGAAGQFTFLLAFAGGTWAGKLAGVTNLGDIGEGNFNWTAAGIMLCGAFLGMLLSIPVIMFWRWLLRHLTSHVYRVLTEQDLLLLGIEPDHLETLPLRPAAPGMPDVAASDRVPIHFADRIRLLIQRYPKCCRALKLPAYPRWAMVLGWAVIILAVDALLYVVVAVPSAQRPMIPMLLMIVGLVLLASSGMRSSQQLAVVAALLADYEPVEEE